MSEGPRTLTEESPSGLEWYRPLLCVVRGDLRSEGRSTTRGPDRLPTAFKSSKFQAGAVH